MGGLPLDIDSYEVAGFQLSHLLLAFVLGASFIFLLYWLWNCPCKSKQADGASNGEENKPILPKQSVKPIYALELEPGTVVLQSEDGEFFRILREYESADQRGHSLSAQEARPLGGSYQGGVAGGTQEQPILPSYTQACYQTMPSAPLPSTPLPSAPPLPNRRAGGYTPAPQGGGTYPTQAYPYRGGAFPTPPLGGGTNPFGDGNPWMPLHTLGPD